MTKSNNTHMLAAAVTAGILAGESKDALANAANFSDMSTNIVESAAGLPSMISTVAYVGGIGLGVAGVFKLKNHVDNPGQTPMKDGLVRLGAGGGLLALPYMTNVMAGSVAGNGTTATGFQANQFTPPTAYTGG